MISFNPNYVANLSQSLAVSSGVEQQLTEELSSGLRVQTLSDDPVAVGQNVLLAGQLSSIDSFTQSASTDQSRLQVTDTTLGQVVTEATSALSLATQATDPTLSSSNVSAIAQQVSDLRNSIVSLANTSYGGTYLFSGSQGETQPFTTDTTTDPATTIYNGDGASQSIVTPNGESIAVNLSGASIFQNANGSLLGALNQLVSDLNSGDTTAVESDSSALSAGLSQLSTQRSVLGNSLSRLNSAVTYANSQEATVTATQSNLLSADTASVATGLSTAETQNQALLSVISSLSKTDLFDDLQN